MIVDDKLYQLSIFLLNQNMKEDKNSHKNTNGTRFTWKTP